jgi:hypothetical protein
MGHCTTCNTELPYPFECARCGRTFCANHRLPENHTCLSSQTYQTPPNGTSQETTKAAKKKTPTKKILLAVTALILAAVLTAGAIGVSSSNQTSADYNRGFDAGYQSGHSSGYDSGFADGHTQGLSDREGHYLKDPTYREMNAFLDSDPTDGNDYYTDTYNCVNFAQDVCDNAFEAGYRCGFVYVEFTDSAHAVACFNTTDRGLIFIEPQTDKQVTLNVGEPY